MNERIKELANQMFSMEQFEYAEEFLNDEFMEKFAKLLIEDVLSELEYRRKEYANPGAYMGDDSYYDRCAAKEDILADVIGDLKYRYEVK